MRNAQNLDVRTTRTYHKCLGRVPRLAGNSGGWRRVSTNLHSTRTAECDHKSLRAVRLKNPCLCLGSSHVHSMGLQFSVKPSGNSIRDRNSYLNTGKSNHCPPDGWMLLEMQTSVLKIHKAGAVASEEPTAEALLSDWKTKSHLWELPLGARAAWVRGSIPYGEGWCFHQTANVFAEKHGDAFLPASLKQLPVGWPGGQIKSSRIYQ